jgi:fumarate reductase subunit C
VSKVETQAKLWFWQRISAVALSLFVLVHLATLVYAVRGGLSAVEILARTRGSVVVAVFYAAFVIACAIHAPIGLARIAEEWLGWSPRVANAFAAAFALLLAITGLRAVYALVVA